MHLLATPGEGDPAAVRLLGQAAHDALSSGAPDEAKVLLKRALAEPAGQDARPELLFGLGAAELLTADDNAVARLAEAAQTLTDPTLRFRAGSLRGHALAFMCRRDEASRAMAEVVASADGAPVAHVALVRGERLFVNLSVRDLGPPTRKEIRALPVEDDTYLRALGDGLRCLAEATSGQPSAPTIERARRAMAVGSPMPYATLLEFTPALALHYADEFDDARGWMAASLAFSRARGHVHSVQMMGMWMAVLEARAGDPGAAAESMLDTQQAGVEAPVLTTLLLAATQARVALERGRLDQADAAVAPALEDDPSLAPLHFVGDLLAARAAVRRARGRAEEAVAEARRAGEATDGWGGSSPSTNGWRAELAFSLAAAGRAQEAAETAEAEVLAARRFGTPRPLATALRALALATQDPAVAGAALEVARSGAPALDVARSLLLAGGLAAHDRRAEEGVDLLGEAMDGAWRVGGERVSEQARAALVGLGARPRRLARRGVDALTPAEARTTRLIAEGVTNREAAETLFVTLGTIERHLTSAYRKLGIAGRAELAASMTADGERSLPSSRGN